MHELHEKFKMTRFETIGGGLVFDVKPAISAAEQMATMQGISPLDMPQPASALRR